MTYTLHEELAAGCSVHPVDRNSWQLPVAGANVVTAQLTPQARHALLHEYAL
jgi:hypothetical protein